MMKARGAGVADLSSIAGKRDAAERGVVASMGENELKGKAMVSKNRQGGDQLNMFGADGEVVAIASGALARGVDEGAAMVARALGRDGGVPQVDMGGAGRAPAFVPVAAVDSGIRPVVSLPTGGRVIQDAGEELVYNRRNRVKAGKRWSDVSGLNDALKVKETVKGNIWPKPDYKQLIVDGMPPMVAHIVKQVYDSVAVKPVIGGRQVLNDLSLQLYFDAVSRVEQGVMGWARDSEALKQWAGANARVAGAMLGRRVEVSSFIDVKSGNSLMDGIYPEGWRAYRDEILILGANKLLGALKPGYDEISRAIRAVEKGWPEKREAWEVQGFRIVENPLVELNTYAHNQGSIILSVDRQYVHSYASQDEADAAVLAVKPFVLFGKRGMVASYASEELAIEAAKERTRREKGNVIGEKGVRVEAAERVGAVRRLEGEDVSSERLVEEFGFRGVNLGNWMKTPAARAEAQLHLNHAFDSAHDLAEMLGVPPKAISLNGMLGLAIGAQGSGGSAAAHFVPGVNEINITRTSGAGSLAHEWGHALDHYFATQGGLASAERPFLTEHVGADWRMNVGQMIDGRRVNVEVPQYGDLRPEVAAAFYSIVNAMDKRIQTDEESKAQQESRLLKEKTSRDGWIRSIRRDYAGLEPAFDLLADRVRAGDLGEGMVAAGRNTYLSPVVVEMRDLYKKEHGRVYSIENSKNLQAWINLVSMREEKLVTEAGHVNQMTATEFAKNAAALDKEKGGKVYWSTKVEKFARAFDAFVSDELEARQARNDYLSHTGREGLTVPMGDERVAVNGAFRVLVDEVKTRETERGVALFSLGDSDVAQRISIPEINAEIARLKKEWPGMPGITVVGTTRELDFDVKSHADGVYYDGHVYVVAGNIVDLKQLRKVIAHECVLHHSFLEMLGDYGFSKLHHGIQSLKKAGDPVVCGLAANILRRYGELPPHSETKEIVARAGEMCLDEEGNVKVEYGFMKSVFAGVAGWLRDKGFKIPFSNVELQGIIHDAGAWIQRDREQVGQSKPALRADLLGEGVLNSFAGVRAANAPVGDLDRWFLGVDGRPRFEIGDADAEVMMQNLGKVDLADLAKGYTTGIELGELLDHPELFEAYPDLKTLWVVIDPNQEGGKFNAGERIIRAGFDKDTQEVSLSSLLHEIQHAIQYQEGFARGGSPGEFKEQDVTEKALSRLNQEVHGLYAQNPDFYRDVVKATQLQIAVNDKYGTTAVGDEEPLVREWWDAIDARDAHPEADQWFSLKSEENLLSRDRVVVSPHEQYRRLAGEVEARLTQARKDMSMEERLASGNPCGQMDVPEKDQIVRVGKRPPLDVVFKGSFSGKVLEVADGVVVQNVGRRGETVRHDVARLSGEVKAGEVADIRYREGVGVVGKEKGVVVER